MKSDILFWLSERADSLSIRLELLAEWLRYQSAKATSDLSMPYGRDDE